MNLTNKHGLPRVIVNALQNDPYDSGRPEGAEKYVTATALSLPPQARSLLETHGDKLTEDASERLFAIWGSAAHGIVERGADDQMIVEQRFYAKLDDWTIGGQVDLYDMREKAIYDHKFTKIYAVERGAKPEWFWQLNVLAWLMRVNFYEVDTLAVLAHLKDWAHVRSKFDSNYPPIAFKQVPVRTLPDAEVERWIRERLADFDAASPRPCTDAERWAQNKYKVFRKGNIRATRTFATPEEADEFISQTRQEDQDKVKEGKRKSLPAQLVVKILPGKYARCDMYCPVRSVCQQNLDCD